MKKQYGWIYVLPALMLLSIVAFGVLGVRSAVSEQRMQQELETLEWKMEPVSVGIYSRPLYQPESDTVKVYNQDKGGPRLFSSEGEILTDEDLDGRKPADADQEPEVYRGPSSVRETFGEDILIWSDFSDDRALLYYKDKLVCVNGAGETVFEKKARIPERYIEGGTSETTQTITGLNRDGFRDGLAVFTLDGCKYGVLDREGNVVIEPVFKGKYSLMVLKDGHVGVFYESIFCIGKVQAATGGEADD